jgi:hypothetical protein
MAEQKLSARDITSIKAGGFLHIILPTVTPGVYESKRIATSTLLAGTGNEPLRLLNVTGNQSQAISVDSFVNTIFVKTVSGTPSIKIGTTPNGLEILDTTDVNTFQTVMAQLPFTTSGTLYFVILSGNVNISINIISI